jgi:transcriptional regulator with XRE-family HTH domain
MTAKNGALPFRTASVRADCQFQIGRKYMLIGDRLRALREEKKFSQGVIEKRTGLLRCYISRVENGYTVPSVETLEKFARALEVPMYQLFYEGGGQPKLLNPPRRRESNDTVWGTHGRDARTLSKFRLLLSRADEADRKLLLYVARKMVKRKPTV